MNPRKDSAPGKGAAAHKPPARQVRPLPGDRGVLYSTIAELAKRSQLVIVGRPGRAADYAAKGPESVKGRYTVKVQELLKGDQPASGLIKLNIPGVAKPLKGGRSAFAPLLGQPKLVGGRSYVLFLRRERGGSGRYELVGGRQGWFALDTKAGLLYLPGRSPEDPVARKYNGSSIHSFLADVRAAAAEAGPR
jgi:hypothetical protein